MSYTEEFITEQPGLVKYRRTETIDDGRLVTVELYLTEQYLDTTEKMTVERYLNNVVDEMLIREEVQRAN